MGRPEPRPARRTIEALRAEHDTLAARLRRPVRLDLASGYQLTIDDTASSVAGASGEPATGTWNGPLGAALRLLGGRLTPHHTPAGLSVAGSTDLDELCSVFPGS